MSPSLRAFSSLPARPCTFSIRDTATWTRIVLVQLDEQLTGATARAVRSGQTVRVWNGAGEVRAVCRVSDRVRPGVAWMPFGGIVDASGALASVNALTREEPTDWGGGSGLYDAFVEVTPCT